MDKNYYEFPTVEEWDKVRESVERSIDLYQLLDSKNKEIEGSEHEEIEETKYSLMLAYFAVCYVMEFATGKCGITIEKESEDCEMLMLCVNH
ncbi:MAG: hypothetical protein FWB80_12565 [Defluviitaleaceae bacterium]|nr:hypothetical protein [Defluviitaleaceae bacterium]